MKNKISAAILISAAVLTSSGCCTATPSKGGMYFPDRQEILCRLKKYPVKPLFPAAADRRAWNGLPETLRDGYIRNAEKALRTPWKLLLAKDYMLFKRNNDRASYQNPYFHNRAKLVDLAVGECVEYKGRFMDEIMEGIWQILSEPTWCIPAHEAIPDGELFPDPRRFQIDLTSSETGKMLCDLLGLLEKELAMRSPALMLRLKMEIMRRVVEPAEKLNDETTWWFCGRNNWTPWCANNITGCGIYLLNDQPERLATLISTYLGISKRFYDRYPDDGGCNEGPTYWRHAGGKYLQQLIQLDNRLQLQGKMFKDEKLRRMCDYLPGMNLCGRWFLSTNDAAPRPSFSPQFLNFVAVKTQSAALAGLASRLPQSGKLPGASDFDEHLYRIFCGNVEKNTDKNSFSAVNYWPDLNIAILRQKPEAPEKGTVISLKGGHNGESHNHLDLGHFTIFSRNKPFIVDIGAGVYTGVTFSEKRYTLWNLNETGHNPPRFSGRGQVPYVKKHQLDVPEFKAQIVLENDSVASVVLDKVYPENVGMKSLKRSLFLDRKTGNVSVRDTAGVEGKKSVEITLFTAVEPISFDRTAVRWQNCTLSVRNIAVKSVVPENRLDDAMKKNWKKLWRIELAGEIDRTGSWTLDFDFSKKVK